MEFGEDITVARATINYIGTRGEQFNFRFVTCTNHTIRKMLKFKSTRITKGLTPLSIKASFIPIIKS